MKNDWKEQQLISTVQTPQVCLRSPVRRPGSQTRLRREAAGVLGSSLSDSMDKRKLKMSKEHPIVSGKKGIFFSRMLELY